MGIGFVSGGVADVQGDPPQIGDGSSASGADSVAIGKNSTASGDTSVSIGSNSEASANNSISIGGSVVSDQPGSIALGSDSTASAEKSIAIGTVDSVGVTAEAPDSIAIGVDALAPDQNPQDGSQSIALGAYATAASPESVAMGGGTDLSSNPGGGVAPNAQQSVAIGHSARVLGGTTQGVAIGNGARVGVDSAAPGSIAIGNNSLTQGATGAIAIGENVEVFNDNVAEMGGNQLVFGGTADTVQDANISNGQLTIEMDEANSAFRFRGRDSTGTLREATVAW